MEWLTLLSLALGAFSIFHSASQADREEARQQKLESEGKDSSSLADKQLDINEKTSQQNYELAVEQFNYQKELNQLTMNREDTAMQRQVADLKAAGLSPLSISGGSPATVLTSANAPQKDISGINTALNNMIGAYNDQFNRNMQRQNFALQNKVQTAQAYTQLAELSMQKKRANLENAILDLDYKYYKNHPERNLGLQSVLINLAERYLSKNGSSVGGLPKVSLPSLSGSAEATPDNLFSFLKSPEEIKNDYNISTPRFISGKKKEITKEDIDKDLNKIEKAQKSRVDEALQFIDVRKDYDSKLKTIWDYTNAKDYYKDFDEFKVVLGSKKNKNKYLTLMNIHYVPHKRLELGK